jgi:hypothetical protein
MLDEDTAGGERTEAVAGVPGNGGGISIRTRSELSALAATFAGISAPLAIDLAMSSYSDGIWLMSIEAPDCTHG